ncbi:HAMP domain-containing histidine kinase [Lacrimispora sp. NSJ-141]|uniref:histidine kinase n=1 Tax=Lientehia hominis TaxID=2897778 RepID=A0AAP2RKI6_9FIRM|nr:HAMP domain-containing histidine kinase [Lientehia hominis]
MKLRTKLMITFFTIVLVPIAMVYICIFALGSFQARTLKSDYDITGVGDMYSGASVQVFNSLTMNVQHDIYEIANKDPDQFEDAGYQQELNQRLAGKYSFLVIRKGEEIIFSGNTDGDEAELKTELPDYRSSDERNDNKSGSVFSSDSKRLIKQQDLTFSDGTRGSVFIVTSVGELIPQIKSMFRDMTLAVLILLIMISALLTMWVYRAILRPLGELKKATKEIKEGNLDYELKIKEKDEIGQLCLDFEEMRQRLKDNAEEKLEYDKENKELISNISHDLKTPITAIKGYVEGIMDGVASSPEKLDKYIRTIYNKANDMDKLIDELTFYSKIDTNKIPYTFSKIDVNAYFEDCVEEIGLELESRNIDLGFFDYTEGPVMIIADAEQLKRVINNIVSNSVKYLDKKKGIINIRLKDDGDFIQIEIEDNGKGIAARDLPNIFDRFYRTDSSRNSSKGGSGIGLSIVRKIIEDHGGRIWATSKESIGTVMHIVLRKYQEVVHE